MSKSPAGTVSSNSSVPWRRSSDQIPMVIAGTKTSMIVKKFKKGLLFSWSRLARLALKNSLGQKAAIELSNTKRR